MTKSFFYDSMIIRERQRIIIREDAKGNQTSRVKVIAYTFVDYRRKTFTDYTSFSPTARKYIAPKLANGEKDDEAFRFFNTAGKTYEHSVLLPDTILDGTKCSRIKGFLIENGDTIFTETLYYLPEAERPITYMGKVNIGNKKYSIIRLDHYDMATGIKGYGATEIVSHNLTKEALKVFAAWKKNAEKAGLKQAAYKTKRRR
jgi:hypothetical protein